jgi:two-component system, NarL family, nitrate/nitrite response regulator NarL
MTARSISVLLADGDPLTRKAIKAVLTGLADIRIVGVAADGAEALHRTCALKPDVVLLDIDLPGLDGIAAAKELRRRLPSCRAIILTTHRHGDFLRQLAASGVKGYIRKDSAPEALRRAIDSVRSGRAFSDDSVTRALLAEATTLDEPGPSSKPDGLTPREREVLCLIANGEGNRAIAVKLKIGLRTAETHRERLMRKLHISTIAGLTKYALSHGLTRPR